MIAWGKHLVSVQRTTSNTAVEDGIGKRRKRRPELGMVGGRESKRAKCPVGWHDLKRGTAYLVSLILNPTPKGERLLAC